MKASRGRGLAFVLGFLLVGGLTVGGLDLVSRDGSGQVPDPATTQSPESDVSQDRRRLPKQAYLRQACQMPRDWIERLDRGWTPGRSRAYDLVIVPKPKNYMGSFINTSHSGPYDFLQEVPLVLYGPGMIKSTGPIAQPHEPTLADLPALYADLMNFEFPRRASKPIQGVLEPGSAPPKLIFTAVIDGGGWNTLELWPDAWPNIRRLMEEGASVEDAIVGSSPSITPATHTNLSTGAFPKKHGVTAIAVRANDGSLVGAFSEEAGNPGPRVMDPTVSLRTTTLPDLWDRANANEPKVGMLSSGNLQLGMIGHGSALQGGDKDIAIILSKGVWATNPELYSMPGYVNTDVDGPEEDIEAVDRSDGAADGKWRGHEIAPVDASPAFAPWENRTMQAVMQREGFGKDALTDLFYVNYKAPDKAGHEWNMIAPEQEDVLKSVDTAIGDMIEWLDDNVGQGNYVFALTADHGQTPLEQGGWPILGSEMVADIGREFDDLDNGRDIIQRTSASSFFSDEAEMKANNVTPEEVSSFMSRYTIGDNVPEGEEVPEGYEDRLDDRIYAGVFPGRKLPKIVACSRG